MYSRMWAKVGGGAGGGGGAAWKGGRVVPDCQLIAAASRDRKAAQRYGVCVCAVAVGRRGTDDDGAARGVGGGKTIEDFGLDRHRRKKLRLRRAHCVAPCA